METITIMDIGISYLFIAIMTQQNVIVRKCDWKTSFVEQQKRVLLPAVMGGFF